MSSSVTTANGVVVVTQVYPQQSVTAVPAPCTMARVSSVLGKFLKGQPKALGTVQIMIGFIVMLSGIVMNIYADTIAVYSGIVYWGALIYISSGALTVAADNKLNACVVKGALGMNIFSTITAGIAILLHSMDFVIDMRYFFCENSGSGDNYACRMYEEMFMVRSHGITGVLLVFSVLEFIVSICVSAFACKAVCHSDPVQILYVENPNAQVTSTSSENLPAPTQNASGMIFSPAVPQSVVNSIKTRNETQRPPAYSTCHP